MAKKANNRSKSLSEMEGELALKFMEELVSFIQEISEPEEYYDEVNGRWIRESRPEFDEDMAEVVALVDDFVTERTTLAAELEASNNLSLLSEGEDDNNSEASDEPEVQVDKAFLLEKARTLFLRNNNLSEDDLAECSPSELLECRKHIMLMYHQLLDEARNNAAEAAKSYSKSPFKTDSDDDFSEESDAYRAAKAAYFQEQIAALEEKIETVNYEIEDIEEQLNLTGLTTSAKLNLQGRMKELSRERVKLQSSRDSYAQQVQSLSE